jgi:hypothetical protein
MQITEIITEGLSKIVYHYTNLHAATKILTTGVFQLSSDIGSIESQYAPEGYSYFLSTTRTKLGGYHDYIGDSAVMFVLDGNFYNQQYRGKSVDYWGNRNPTQDHHRAHEAEDRIFSKKPTIPISGVTEVHIYVNPAAEDKIKAWGRKAIIAAKTKGITTYFYTDKIAWKTQDTRKVADIKVLKGQEFLPTHWSRHRGWLTPWMEVITAKDKSQLSKKGNELRYNLVHSNYKNDTIKGFDNEMSNARKPSAGRDRELAVKIISYMQQHKLKTSTDLVDHLIQKWQSLEK